MSLHTPTEFEIFGIHHGGHRDHRDLVCARASRAKSQNLSSVFSVCSVVGDHPGHCRSVSLSQSSPLISKENTKVTKNSDNRLSDLRALRGLRGNNIRTVNLGDLALTYFTGRNFGRVYSGKSSKTTSTAMPIFTSSGAHSTTLVTSRPPSSRSTSETL